MTLKKSFLVEFWTISTRRKLNPAKKLERRKCVCCHGAPNAQLCSVGGNARCSRVLSMLFGVWHAYKPLICFSFGYLVGRCVFISNLSTLIQKSCVFKLFHTRERIQNVLFLQTFLCRFVCCSVDGRPNHYNKVVFSNLSSIVRTRPECLRTLVAATVLTASAMCQVQFFGQWQSLKLQDQWSSLAVWENKQQYYLLKTFVPCIKNALKVMERYIQTFLPGWCLVCA